MIQAEQFLKEKYDLLWMYLGDFKGKDTIERIKCIEMMEEYANQYKELLFKYIQHVEECEGTTFIDFTFSDVNFTDNELKLLKELAKK